MATSCLNGSRSPDEDELEDICKAGKCTCDERSGLLGASAGLLGGLLLLRVLLEPTSCHSSTFLGDRSFRGVLRSMVTWSSDDRSTFSDGDDEESRLLELAMV